MSETALFVSILADHLHRKETQLPQDTDWRRIADLALSQQVGGIVYSQVKAGIPEGEGKAKLAKQYSSHCYLSLKRETILGKITAAFSAEGIPFVIFKGTEIARYYPIPMLRTMGDSDFLIHARDWNRANAVLEKLGGVCDCRGQAEWKYRLDSLAFELHTELAGRHETGMTNTQWSVIGNPWQYAAPTGEGSRYAFSLPFHLVYLLTHLYKHFVFCGVGFRQFMDIAVLSEVDSLAWEQARALIEQAGLTVFAQRCFSFCGRCFSTELPFSVEPMSEQSYQSTVAMLCRNGVFGFHDERNRNNRLMFELGQEKSKNGLLAKKLISLVFPSYRTLCDVPAYAFLRGKPYLLPFAWGYRFCYTLRHRKMKNGVVSATTALGISDEENRQRAQLLGFWGISAWK